MEAREGGAGSPAGEGRTDRRGDRRPIGGGGREARRTGRASTNPVRAARQPEGGPRVPGGARALEAPRGPQRPAPTAARPPAAAAPSPSKPETRFALRPGSPFIELQNLLKVVGAVDSGGGAKFAIQGEMVSVNGEVETRRSRKLVEGDVVEHAGLRVRVVPSPGDGPPSR
jgi:ribosome-associated protein